MEPFFALIAVVVGFLALGMAAIAWGVDSRPSESDGYRRTTINGDY
jgi:nitrogen fixation-related uncharacterized protein